MLRLVRMLVLIHEPGPTTAEIALASHPAVQQCGEVAEPVDKGSQPKRRQPSEPVVKPDDRVAAWFQEFLDRVKSRGRISGVMEDSIGDDDVEAVSPKERIEQVHLHEMSVVD